MNDNENYRFYDEAAETVKHLLTYLLFTVDTTLVMSLCFKNLYCNIWHID